jgi:hypothetical protein
MLGLKTENILILISDLQRVLKMIKSLLNLLFQRSSIPSFHGNVSVLC